MNDFSFSTKLMSNKYLAHWVYANSLPITQFLGAMIVDWFLFNTIIENNIQII